MSDRLASLEIRLTTPRLVGLTIMVVIGLTAVAGASLAVAQIDSPQAPADGKYQGCVNSYTGVLRIIEDTRQCQDHETPILLGAGSDIADLLARIEALEAEVITLQQQNIEQQNAINTLITETTAQQTTIDNLITENQNQQISIDALNAQVPTACPRQRTGMRSSRDVTSTSAVATGQPGPRLTAVAT